MTITATFNTYEEMLEFAASLLRKEQEVAAKEPEAVAEAPETVAEAPDPAPAQEKTYTMTEVRAFLGNLRKAGKKEAVTALIRDLGYEKFTDIPEEKYGELMEKAEGL